MKEKIHKNKKYLALFYNRCEMLIQQFTDNEIGEIIRGAINYELYGETPAIKDRALSIMCSALCSDIDIMTEKANKRSKDATEAANNRWKTPAEREKEDKMRYLEETMEMYKDRND